jgi:hypothetical protein
MGILSNAESADSAHYGYTGGMTPAERAEKNARDAADRAASAFGAEGEAWAQAQVKDREFYSLYSSALRIRCIVSSAFVLEQARSRVPEKQAQLGAKLDEVGLYNARLAAEELVSLALAERILSLGMAACEDRVPAIAVEVEAEFFSSNPDVREYRYLPDSRKVVILKEAIAKMASISNLSGDPEYILWRAVTGKISPNHKYVWKEVGLGDFDGLSVGEVKKKLKLENFTTEKLYRLKILVHS